MLLVYVVCQAGFYASIPSYIEGTWKNYTYVRIFLSPFSYNVRKRLSSISYFLSTLEEKKPNRQTDGQTDMFFFYLFFRVYAWALVYMLFIDIYVRTDGRVQDSGAR